MIRAALLGALFAIVGAFPVAAVVAIVYQFPIPFVGYSSGFDAVVPSLYAVMFYGIFLGGFVVLALGGAIGGVIADSVRRPKEKAVGFLCLGIAFTVDVVAVLVMAVLDKLIGPW